MKIAVVGSRDYPLLDKVEYVVSMIADQFPEATIISGGAIGVDDRAEEAARKYGLAVVSMAVPPEEWDRLGKKAGPLRNQRMVDACDKLIAFWDGQSRGTAWSIRYASQKAKLLNVFDRSGELMTLAVAYNAANRVLGVR